MLMIGALVNMEDVVQCYLHLVQCLPDPDNYMMTAAGLVIKLFSESSPILLSEYVINCPSFLTLSNL